MRLINADTLKAEVTGNFFETYHYTAVRALIDVEPTAYDLDKVVEQLETKVKEIEDFNSITYEADIYVDTRREALLEAVEIVKGGKKMNVTDIIAEVKDDFCMNYCKYKEECDERMEKNEELRPCPLDRL